MREKAQNIEPDDIRLLKTRLISHDDPSYPKHALHIFPIKAKCKEYNRMMLDELSKKNPPITMTAADICLDRKTHKSFRRKEPLKTEDSCLSDELTLCVGARVMLTYNLDVEDGLTNGAMGTVTSIITTGGALGLPTAVCIRFDDITVGRKSRQRTPPPSTYWKKPHRSFNTNLFKSQDTNFRLN